MKKIFSILTLSPLLALSASSSSAYILKPETLDQLSRKLGYKVKEAAIEDYMLFSERIQAGFVKEEWLNDCKKTKNKALCVVIEDYFDFIKKDVKKEKAKRFFASVGKITKKNIQKMQSGNFQGLLHALPSKNKKLLLEYAREAVNSSSCPQNLSLALAYNLEPFAGNPNYFPLVEKLYSRGLACAKPSDQAYELANLRFALIYASLNKNTEAVKYFKKALEAEFPREDYRSLYWLAHLLKKDKAEESEEYTSALIEKYPRSWYTIKLLNEKNIDPLKMNLRASVASDLYSVPDTRLDLKFTWLKMGLLLESDPYKLKKYAEYLSDQIPPHLEFGYIQHLARLLHSADLYKAQIGIITKYLTVSNPPVTKEILEYLYPAPYLELFNLHGVELDTALLLGLARQESSFDVRAKSGANAWGLLQMLPSTARQMGSKKSHKLWNPSDNIRYASKYLIRLAQRFNNSIERSLAAYNAGPVRVEEWEKNYAWVKDPEIFMDLIPYRETRDYVPTILRNAYWYHRLYPGTLNISKTEYVTSGLLKPLIVKFQ